MTTSYTQNWIANFETLRKYCTGKYLSIIIFIIILLFSFIPIRYVIHPGFFPIHDDTQVGRVVVMARGLSNFEFPVRWVKDLGYGYGYPLFNFYGPLPYYIGGIFHAIGIDALISTKIMIGIGMLLSSIFMYICSVRFIGAWGAGVAAIFYTFAPYRAVDLYVRGAIGELWAIAFLPLVLYGCIHLLMKKDAVRLSDFFLLSFGVFFTIISHTIVGFMMIFLLTFGLMTGMVIALIHASVRSTPFIQFLKPLITIVFAVTIGLLMSMWFWFPALTEMKFTNVSGQIGGGADYRNHFVCLHQLWSTNWGFGGSTPGCVDGMSFMAGKLHIIVFGIGFLLLFIRPIANFIEKRLILYSALCVTLCSIFYLLPISQSVWNLFGYMSYIQYPWRFLSFILLGTAIIGGTLISLVQSKLFQSIASIILCTSVIVLHTKQYVPQYIYDRPTSEFMSEEELRFRISKISDEFLPPAITRPKTKEGIIIEPIISTEGITVETVVDLGTYFLSVITASTDAEVPVRRAYFPGWKYLLDRKQYTPVIKDGIPIFIVPSGMHKIELIFVDTPVRFISNIISITVFVFYFWFYDKKIYL